MFWRIVQVNSAHVFLKSLLCVKNPFFRSRWTIQIVSNYCRFGRALAPFRLVALATFRPSFACSFWAATLPTRCLFRTPVSIAVSPKKTVRPLVVTLTQLICRCMPRKPLWGKSCWRPLKKRKILEFREQKKRTHKKKQNKHCMDKFEIC